MQAKNDGLALVTMYLPTKVSGLCDAELLPEPPQTLFNLSLNFIWGCDNIYCPQRSWGKVMFSQARVILFTGGGVCLSACWDTKPPSAPGSRHLPEQTPWEQTTPWSRHPPPGAEQAGIYGQRAGGTHPTGMQSCLNNIVFTQQIDFYYQGR